MTTGDTAAAPQAAARSADHNIARDLEHMAREHGTLAAFAIPGERGGPTATITFAELEQRVARCAGGLARSGTRAGDRVVVFVPMSVELYVLLLAIFRIGAVAVFIDPWGSRSMIDGAARLVDPSLFIGIPKSHLLRATSGGLRAIPRAIVVGAGRRSPAALLPRTSRLEDVLDAGRGCEAHDTAAVALDDPALITFTTGTTGGPKGANRTHGFLLAQHATLGNHLEQGPGDVHLTNLPIFVLHNLGCGVTTVLPPPQLAQDPQPDGTWLHGMVRRHEATVLTLSPAPVDALTRSTDRTPLASVRRVYTGGGPVLPGMLARAGEVMPNAGIVVLYGSTEAEPIAHCDAADVLARRDAVLAHGGIYVGREVAEIDLRLVRPTRRPIEVAEGSTLADWEVEQGTVGEVVVAGDHVQREYYRNEQAFVENKVVDEHGVVWHRTGDMARRDDDGGLWLLGRLTSGFELDGRTMYPFEVETALGELAEVARAAVCVPAPAATVGGDPSTAGAIVCVEPARGFTREHARDAARRHLASRHLGALEVRTLQRIPVDKRHGTKIDMPALRAALGIDA